MKEAESKKSSTIFEINESPELFNYIKQCLTHWCYIKYNTRDKCLTANGRYPRYPGTRVCIEYHEQLFLKRHGTIDVIHIRVEDKLVKHIPAKDFTWAIVIEEAKKYAAESTETRD